MPPCLRILIIGAGPAGSIAAIVLARAGREVTLLEQHRFPRDKVCGECLSALGVSVLQRLGLRDRLMALGAVRLGRAMLHAQGGASVAVTLNQPMWGISRAALDAMLLGEARNAGAQILQPARCELVSRGGGEADEAIARVRELDSNRVTEIGASCVLLADGKGALLPRRPAGTADLGIKAHFRNIDGPAEVIELFGVDAHYAGVAAIEGARWNLAFSVPADRVARHRGDLDGLLAAMLCENPSLRRRFRNARRIGDWLASPLPRFGVAGDWPANVIPLGNAAAAIEPIGGEGIGLAMRSAELAAAELLDAHRAGRPPCAASIQRAYARLWRVRSITCRAAARLISSPALATPAAQLLGDSPAIQSLAMALLGKS